MAKIWIINHKGEKWYFGFMMDGIPSLGLVTPKLSSMALEIEETKLQECLEFAKVAYSAKDYGVD